MAQAPEAPIPTHGLLFYSIFQEIAVDHSLQEPPFGLPEANFSSRFEHLIIFTKLHEYMSGLGRRVFTKGFQHPTIIDPIIPLKSGDP